MKIIYKIYRKDLLAVLECLIAANTSDSMPAAFQIMFGGSILDLQRRIQDKLFTVREKYTVSFTPIEVMLILIIMEKCIDVRQDLPYLKTAYMAIDRPVPVHVGVAIALTRKHLMSVTGQTYRDKNNITELAGKMRGGVK